LIINVFYYFEFNFLGFLGKACVQGSTSRDFEEVELDATTKFVPDWILKNDSIVDTPNTYREYMHSARTLAEVNYGANLSDKKLSNSSCVYAVNAFYHFIELHDQFVDHVRSNQMLKNQVTELQETESQVPADNSLLRKSVTDLQGKCSSLEKEIENGNSQAAELKLMKARVLELESMVTCLEGERGWLISEGMARSFEKIRNGDKYLNMLAGVQSMANTFVLGLMRVLDLLKLVKRLKMLKVILMMLWIN
jgi:hypothetical protein